MIEAQIQSCLTCGAAYAVRTDGDTQIVEIVGGGKWTLVQGEPMPIATPHSLTCPALPDPEAHTMDRMLAAQWLLGRRRGE